jgi:hypothetical protein
VTVLKKICQQYFKYEDAIYDIFQQYEKDQNTISFNSLASKNNSSYYVRILLLYSVVVAVEVCYYILYLSMYIYIEYKLL